MTCENLAPFICDRKCNAGCFCIPGFVRHFDGVTCVLPENCKLKRSKYDPKYKFQRKIKPKVSVYYKRNKSIYNYTLMP
ncbi:hypothetical protein B4U79_02122, partial [Dinothrombium tinctorium]